MATIRIHNNALYRNRDTQRQTMNFVGINQTTMCFEIGSHGPEF